MTTIRNSVGRSANRRSVLLWGSRDPAGVVRSAWGLGLTVALGLGSMVASVAPAVACPNADKLVEHLIEAHGGMASWAAAPTVSFEDEFRVGAATEGAVSRVVVEQGRRRAYIDYPGTEMSLGWDGETAWSENWASPYPPRFLALLNYHFLNLPWLAADPGVVLSEFGTRTLPEDPTEYFSAKISYEDGVGDTPRDYYRLYVHPETHRLRAVQYIVTYRSLLPEGVDETPANTLIYDEYVEVDGLWVASRYTIYRPDGALFGSFLIRDWSFARPFDESRMTRSAQAVVDESTP